jgi:hypothetical protein
MVCEQQQHGTLTFQLRLLLNASVILTSISNSQFQNLRGDQGMEKEGPGGIEEEKAFPLSSSSSSPPPPPPQHNKTTKANQNSKRNHLQKFDFSMHDSSHYHDPREYVVGTQLQEKKLLEQQGEASLRAETPKNFLRQTKVRFHFFLFKKHRSIAFS